jgi:UrcA family protein
MKNRVGFWGAFFILAGISAAGIAQSATQPPDQVSRFGPYVVTKSFKTSPYNVDKKTTSMSRVIDYRGLDLTSDADVAKLETRVRQVAEDICQELDRRNPRTIYTSVPEAKNCVADTSETALADVRAKVAMARANRQSAQKQ